MPRILDPTRHEAVAADGLPRVAAYDDGSEHVLYLDGAVVRSMLAAAWPPPLPTEPTPEEIAAALALREQQRLDALADAAALRTRVRSLAQGAVGVAIDQLTAQQVRALFAILLWKEGALNRDGVVRPLSEWVRD